MRVYFLSYIPAALKLNGIYAGVIDAFEKRIELDLSDKIFAEIIPDENLQGINFFLDNKFFENPPSVCDAYLFDGDALIYVREYQPKDAKIEVLYQTRFCGKLITVFSQGNIYLSIEGAEYSLTPLPLSFKKLSAATHTLNGREVFALSNGRHLILVDDAGKIIFKSAANEFEAGKTLKIFAELETCNALKAECEYSYDGNLKLIGASVNEQRSPEREILHFAFFESVLVGADFKKYLTDELKAKAENLKSYLGEFTSVTVPPEKFFLTHENVFAAGLTYPKSKNLFEIKYFAVDFEGDKICNIYPA